MSIWNIAKGGLTVPNIVKGGLTVPALAGWFDVVTQSPLLETVEQTVWTVDAVMNVWNSMLNPLFATVAWWASAWLLTNSILNDLWMENKWARYGLSWVAAITWYAAWTVAAPYLVAGGLSYAIWKHWWKYWKEALKRWVWAWWWATWGTIKWAVKGCGIGVWEWLKWNQKINPVIQKS